MWRKALDSGSVVTSFCEFKKRHLIVYHMKINVNEKGRAKLQNSGPHLETLMTSWLVCYQLPNQTSHQYNRPQYYMTHNSQMCILHVYLQFGFLMPTI